MYVRLIPSGRASILDKGVGKIGEGSPLGRRGWGSVIDRTNVGGGGSRPVVIGQRRGKVGRGGGRVGWCLLLMTKDERNRGDLNFHRQDTTYEVLGHLCWSFR